MKPIEIHSIPYKKMRYPTVGDYFDDDSGTHIVVADMQNEDYEFLVILHELVEQYLCRKRGIKEEDISAFDIEFEKNRTNGYDEPGDSPDAPYKREHVISSIVERLIAYELNVDWTTYNNKIIEICERLENV
jgi:hypothetical protein